MKTLPDYIGRSGLWVQRQNKQQGGCWSVSGIMWNNIKERCTVGGTTQRNSPTYIGAVNAFSDFQAFVAWHQGQKGYGRGYELDADILKNGTKIYSESTCLLIPQSLNKFISEKTRKKVKLPQGVFLRKGRLCVEMARTHITSLAFSEENIVVAQMIYKKSKEDKAKEWASTLQAGAYEVDQRVVDYLDSYQFECEWKLNDKS